jgi:hypothetical protein
MTKASMREEVTEAPKADKSDGMVKQITSLFGQIIVFIRSGFAMVLPLNDDKTSDFRTEAEYIEANGTELKDSFKSATTKKNAVGALALRVGLELVIFAGTSAVQFVLGVFVSLTLVPSIVVLLISLDMPMTDPIRSTFNTDDHTVTNQGVTTTEPLVTYFDLIRGKSSHRNNTEEQHVIWNPGWFSRYNQPAMWWDSSPEFQYVEENSGWCQMNCMCDSSHAKDDVKQFCKDTCWKNVRTVDSSNNTMLPISASDGAGDDTFKCSFALGNEPSGRCCTFGDEGGMTAVPVTYNSWHEPLRCDFKIRPDDDRGCAFSAEDAQYNFAIMLLATFMILTFGVGPHFIADIITKLCTFRRVVDPWAWLPWDITARDLIFTTAQFRIERKVWDLSLDPLDSLVDDHIDKEELALLYDIEEQRTLGIDAIAKAEEMQRQAKKVLNAEQWKKLLSKLTTKKLTRTKSFDIVDAEV